MHIYRNAEAVHGHREFGNPCAKAIQPIFQNLYSESDSSGKIELTDFKCNS